MSAETPSLETQLPEGNFLTRYINPVRSRIIGAIFDNSLLNPRSTLHLEKTEDFKNSILQATPESINFKPVEDASTESRRKYWKNKSFEEQNMEWNSQVWGVIQDMVKADNANGDEAAKTLNLLEINPSDDSLNETELNNQVENFRAKYFEGESKVKEFAESIAKGCLEDGVVNMELFEKRLNAVDNLLGAFSSKDDIVQLVKDYAYTYSLLTQKAKVKEQLVETILPYVKAAQPEQERRRGGFLGFLNNLLPFAGLAGIGALAHRETTQTRSDSDDQERGYGGDTPEPSSSSESQDTTSYYDYDYGDDNNGREGGDTNDAADSYASDRGYTDIGARDYGDQPDTPTSSTGGFEGYSDVGARDHGDSGRATDTGGFSGYTDIGGRDYGDNPQGTDTGGFSGYTDIGDSDYGSGERATDTGGFGGYADIGAPDRGDSDGDGDGD